MSIDRTRIPFDEMQQQQGTEKTQQFLRERGLEESKIAAILQRRHEGWLQAREIWVKREKTKREFGALFDDVLISLTQRDILGIADEQNPNAATEYEPEVGIIIPRLGEAQSAGDVERIVKEEFLRWFGPGNYLPEAILRERFRLIADEIWTALLHYRE